MRRASGNDARGGPQYPAVGEAWEKKNFFSTKNPVTVVLATAVFKAEMAQHIKDYNKKGWKFCPPKYWLFKKR